MNNFFRLKVFLLFLYAFISFYFFYEDNFVQNSIFILTPHIYDNIAFMVTTFCLGIIFSSMIYNFAFYFYIRNIQYFYYALVQFFILLSLVTLEGLLVEPFIEIYSFKNFYLLEISQTLMLIFSLLFIQEFFETKKIKELNQIITIVIYLSWFDVILSFFVGHTFITKFIPTVIWIFFILSETYRYVKVKDVPFYFVMLGWHSVILVLFLELTYLLNPEEINFPLLPLAFALESMLLSFALSYKFKLIENKQKIQQSLLLQQSRLASMGEMISIIAHQWRQPLNFLSYFLMYIKQNCKENDPSLQMINDANDQLQYMSQTIENFRNFYNPSKEKKRFDIASSCQNILKIVLPTLNPLGIKIKLEIKENFFIFANSNEFEQVILNIVNNAKDVLIERVVKDGNIKIVVNTSSIIISDNGGGIQLDKIEKIFEPYFTTKKESDGIGLYIAKTIIENEIKGTLLVQSDTKGSSFILKL